MIDAKTEQLVAIRKSPSHFPGERPHISAVYRWLKRNRLESILVGGRRYTSIEAIHRFVAGCNKPSSSEAAQQNQRQCEIAKAEAELRAVGIA